MGISSNQNNHKEAAVSSRRPRSPCDGGERTRREFASRRGRKKGRDDERGKLFKRIAATEYSGDSDDAKAGDGGHLRVRGVRLGKSVRVSRRGEGRDGDVRRRFRGEKGAETRKRWIGDFGSR